MPKQLTHEQFVVKAREVHEDKGYDYPEEYKKSSQLLTIYCKDHGDFKQTPNKHLMGRGCPKCGNINRSVSQRHTREQFVAGVKEHHKETYDYSKAEYVNNNTLVTIICRKHGEFRQLPSNHYSGQGCRKCAIEARADSDRMTLEEFIDKANKRHENRYEYSLYINNHTKVDITCREHGIFQQRPGDHLSGQGCSKCGMVSSSVKQSMGAETFLAKAKEVHGDKYEYPELVYKNNTQMVNIHCTECKRDFVQRAGAHINERHGCPYCCQFRSEKLAREIIENLTGVTFPKIRPSWLNGLELDGYSEFLDAAFEYQGKQHYEYIEHFHRSEENFRKRLGYDQRKRMICKERNIYLIEIPFTYDYRNPDRMRGFIRDQLKQDPRPVSVKKLSA